MLLMSRASLAASVPSYPFPNRPNPESKWNTSLSLATHHHHLPFPTMPSSSPICSMEKLIEVDSHEITIDFQLSTKCRAEVRVRSLHPSLAIAFKVQTSSPNKFLVNPPSSLLSPLSSLSFQIILRPQSSPPSSFPRSPSDRFLIKSAPFPIETADHHPISTATSSQIQSFFSSNPRLPTHDLKLKVIYAGPFLLRHAIVSRNLDAARQILRRQRFLLSSLSSHEARLLEIDAESGVPQRRTIHEAAAEGIYEEVVEMVAKGDASVDDRDGEGRTALHVATGKGYVRCVRALAEMGAERDARSRDGRTALHRAAANGDGEMVALLLEMGADPSVANARGRTPLDVARDKGHKEVVEVLERGELVLTAARRGDVKRLESLLKKGIGTNSCDQYGMTALHSAAIKGHHSVVCLLAEYGMDLECEDVEGHTPLHLGVEGGWLEIVEALVAMGANVNAMSKRGATPLYMAKSMGYDDISQLLLSRGASFSTMASSSSTSYA